jgi:8-amino-7-oxononanoate synthase
MSDVVNTKASALDRLKAGFLSRSAGTGVGAGTASAGASVAPAKAVRVSPEHHEFDKFPEYRDYTTMRWYYEQQKFETNLFREHLGVSGATVRIDGREMINFSSYNYLGLAADSRVREAAKKAIDDFGTSTGSGRSITGEVSLHAAFEREISEVLGCDDAVVSVGGYSMNAFTIGYLCRRQDLILYDELIHNSALIGCKITGARRFAFPHNDFDALEKLLQEHRGNFERVFILVEGVYSMDGDIPDIPKVIEIKKRYKALLMVDEAHSMGVIGPHGLGVTDHFGIPGREIDILYGSMSKSFATCGGYVAGSPALVAMLKHYAPGVLLYGASPTPANTAAGLEALRIMRAEPERALRVQSNADHFRHCAHQSGLSTGLSKGSGVVPIMLADSELALNLSVRLFESNICTYPMMYPIVPRNAVRLRFFINTDHTHAQIEHTIDKLIELKAKAPRSKGVI